MWVGTQACIVDLIGLGQWVYGLDGTESSKVDPCPTLGGHAAGLFIVYSSCRCCSAVNGTWDQFDVQCESPDGATQVQRILFVYRIDTCGCIPCNDGKSITRKLCYRKDDHWPRDVRYISGSNESLRRYGHSKLSKKAACRQLGFDVTGNSAIRSADPENPTLEPNMKCIGSPVAEIWPFAYLGASVWGQCINRWLVHLSWRYLV